MKIQKIYSSLCTRQSFKSEKLYENWDYDYGTYYNDISIKDAILSASIISGVMTLAGMLFTNEDKIKKLFKKIVPSLKKEHINQII